MSRWCVGEERESPLSPENLEASLDSPKSTTDTCTTHGGGGVSPEPTVRLANSRRGYTLVLDVQADDRATPSHLPPPGPVKLDRVTFPCLA